MSSTPPDTLYVTTCECDTPLGATSESWQALCEGKIGLKHTPVRGIDGCPSFPLSLFEALGTAYPPRWMAPCVRLVQRLPQKPWGHPGFPVFVSSSNFGIEQLLAYHQSPADARLKAFGTPAFAVRELSKVCGFGPEVTVISNACVSAQLALSEAELILRARCAEEALVLSFDFLSAFVIGGFASLKILNENGPKPYQRTLLSAIGLGEGVAAAILSRKKSPFELVGTVACQESHHMTGNDPTGAGYTRIAQEVASLAKGSSFWLKGHGTGTIDAGSLEAQAFEEQFPNSPLASWKGSLGHTLGSCGLIEMAIALEAFRQGKSPGTPGAEPPFFSDTVAQTAFSVAGFDAVALFSSAFGGAHLATLVRHA